MILALLLVAATLSAALLFFIQRFEQPESPGHWDNSANTYTCYENIGNSCGGIWIEEKTGGGILYNTLVIVFSPVLLFLYSTPFIIMVGIYCLIWDIRKALDPERYKNKLDIDFSETVLMLMSFSPFIIAICAFVYIMF